MQADGVPDALWPRLSEFVAANIGLHFPPERRPDLQRGITSAAVEFGFADTAAYANWLLSTPLTRPQIHMLASHLAIGETYFFREPKAFDALAKHILPELIRHRRGSREKRLRLWSAACSTGEEPYSLAILLQQLIPDWQDWDVTILATDINKRFLQRAVAGVYGEWSFRQSPPGFRERYFTRTAGGRFAVVPGIRNRVRFAQLNLAQDGLASLANDTHAMDVIFCRNVLMYFTPAHTHKLVENLRHALNDGGWLAVSPSECSQSLFSRFIGMNFPGTILYQKRNAEERIPTWSAAPSGAAVGCETLALDALELLTPEIALASQAKRTDADSIGVPAASGEPLEPFAAAESLYLQGRYADAAEMLLASFATAAESSASPPQTTPGSQAFSLLARARANQGKLRDALGWSERWIAADKLNAAAHYLHAMVLQELGDRERARRSLQRVVYLQPDFALAHFALGNLARNDLHRTDANKHFENALHFLRARPPDEPVPESDGLTARRLTEIITALSLPGETFQ